MVLIWAFRLGIFLVVRIRRAGKDRRFDTIRGNFYKWGRFWLAQAVTVWILMLPAVFLYIHGDPRLTGYSYIGLVIWGAGLCIETIADLQKYRFSRSAHTEHAWIDSGLWAYSRHPNYFGEILVWIGLYALVLPALSSAQAIIAVISPLTITLLLRFVSGVPPLEAYADHRWGKDHDYQRYKRRTGLLIPLPPKHVD